MDLLDLFWFFHTIFHMARDNKVTVNVMLSKYVKVWCDKVSTLSL